MISNRVRLLFGTVLLLYYMCEQLVKKGYSTGRPMKRPCRVRGAPTPGTSSMLQWERDAWEYADEDEKMREEYEREYNKDEGEEVGGSEEKVKAQPALKVPPD